jgi:hypothetical protein
MPAITVAGVVGNVKQGALDQPTVEQMYEPVSQAAAALGPLAAMLGVAGTMNAVIRTSGRSLAAGTTPPLEYSGRARDSVQRIATHPAPLLYFRDGSHNARKGFRSKMHGARG